MSKRKVTKPAYRWDDDRGVIAIGKYNDSNDTQAIQLLHGPASLAFRRECGLLLVAALNRRAAKARKP